MDWREMVGRATIEERIGEYTRLPPSLGRQSHTLNNDNILEHIGKDGLVHPKPASSQDDPSALLKHTQEQQRKQSEAAQSGGDQGYVYAAADPKRGWVLGAAWIIASSIEYVRTSPDTLRLISSLLQHCIHLPHHPEADPHPRLQLDSRNQSYHPHHVLRFFLSHLSVLLGNPSRISGLSDYLGRAALRPSGDERRVPCRSRLENRREERGRFADICRRTEGHGRSSKQ
jgi:hypothetical protein